jgi:putative toxin-antitoxin system antitoxin component (TIGR02293 family)
MTDMAKLQKYSPIKDKKWKVSESSFPYAPTQPAVMDFNYKKLKKIMDVVPFTQSEWANMIHLSERTLQRYAKNNTSFESIYIDRILHLQELIALGLDTFTDADNFYAWLKDEKHVLGKVLNFESLHTDRGIQLLIDQVNRIQYGVYS